MLRRCLEQAGQYDDGETEEGLEEGTEEGMESLAVEVETGEGTLRALWRWTCFQAAEQIGAASQPGRRGPSAGMLEVCARLNRRFLLPKPYP